MSARGRSAAAALLMVGALACDQRQRDRVEAGRVLHALEVVRAAPNEGKRRPADELSNLTCSTPVVCGARDRCAEAYHHLAVGTEAALRVKNELDKLEQQPLADAAKMSQLSGELDRADSEINGARESMLRCEEAASAMRSTFGI